MTRTEKTRKYVVLALFCALAFVSEIVFRIKVSFLTFDIKDTVIAICALFFGPISGIITSLAVALLELITVSDTGFYGFVMNFVSSAVFCAIPALFYKYRKDIFSAALGLFLGAFAMTGIMLVLNILITPYYMGVETSAVVDMIPTLLLPFNLVKGTLNAALTALLYKPVTTALRRTGLIKRQGEVHNNKYTTLIVAACAILIAVCCALIFIISFDGSLEFLLGGKK